MKKLKTTILISSLFFWLFLVSISSVHADVIHDFNFNSKINSDSSVTITETIKYDFEKSEKHGIYRDIPVKYKASNGNNSVLLEVESISIDGLAVKNEVINKGLNKEIKIGNENTLISGEHTYVIVYKVKNAINYFADFDELYWNITGNLWEISIEKVNASIELPSGVDITKIKKSCYIGVYGSKESCQLNIIGNTIVSDSARLLNAGEGITIAVGFPKGVVFEPSKIDNLKSIISDNLILLLPFVVFIFMFLIWKRYGKDPKGYSTIIAQYEPPKGMKPTLVGSLMDEKVDFRDITAGLIYLAEQGYVKVNKLEKTWAFGNDDYELVLLKKDTSSLEKTEKDILELFFSNLNLNEVVKISSFRKDFTFKSRVQLVISSVYKEMTERGFYEKNPTYAMLPYLIAPFFIIPISIFLFNLNNFLEISSVIVSGLIIFIFGFFMGKKTKLGAETKDYILGFKDFLSVTEKDRLDFHNAPEKNPELFMKYLPYSIALGVEKKWAKQFDGMYIEEPSWYRGNIVGAFVVSDFVSHMSGMSQSFNTAAAGQSGSGGGGFSGGGGGGGGGGSW